MQKSGGVTFLAITLHSAIATLDAVARQATHHSEPILTMQFPYLLLLDVSVSTKLLSMLGSKLRAG